MSSGASRPRRAVCTLLATLLALFCGASGIAGASAATLRPYQPAGTKISGAANPGSARLLSPGRYLDTFDTADEDSSDDDAGKYYLVMLSAGDTPYFSATEVPPARPDVEGSVSLTINVEAVHSSDISCSFTPATAYDSSVDGKLNTVTALFSPGQVGGADWDEDCPVNAEYAVQVIRTGDAYPGSAIPTEINYHEEPSARTTGLPGPARVQGNIQAQTDGASTPIPTNLADSFDDAPVLAPGRYRDRFTPGETRYYRVHLSWGQRFAYTITTEQNPAVEDGSGVNGNATIVNPLRETVAQPDRANASTTDLGASIATMFGSTPVPARYTNRDSDDDKIQAYAVDGYYYLALWTNYPDTGDSSATVAFTVDIDVTGARERGPVYSRGGPLPKSAQPSNGASSTLIVVAVVAGVLLITAAIVIVVIARRRRRRRWGQPGPPSTMRPQTMPLNRRG